MTKQNLIELIEDEENYSQVHFENECEVWGYESFGAVTQTLLGNDTELLAALVDVGKVSQETADTYNNQ